MSRLYAFRQIPRENEDKDGAEVAPTVFAGFIVAEDAKIAEAAVREQYEVSGEIELRRFKGSGLLFVLQGVDVEVVDTEEIEDADLGQEMSPVVSFDVSGDAAETFLSFVGIDYTELVEGDEDGGEGSDQDEEGDEE